MTLQNIGDKKEAMDNIAMSGILRPGDPGRRGEVYSTDVPKHLVQHGGIHIAQSAYMGRCQSPNVTGNLPLNALISNILLSIATIKQDMEELVSPDELLSPDDNTACTQDREVMLEARKRNIRHHLVASLTTACGIYTSTPLTNTDPNYRDIGM